MPTFTYHASNSRNLSTPAPYIPAAVATATVREVLDGLRDGIDEVVFCCFSQANLSVYDRELGYVAD